MSLTDTGAEASVTKSDFVQQVAQTSGLSKRDAKKAVDAILESIQEVLSRGGEINFTGFGKFSVADRSARQGVNRGSPPLAARDSPISGDFSVFFCGDPPERSFGQMRSRCDRPLPPSCVLGSGLSPMAG